MGWFKKLFNIHNDQDKQKKKKQLDEIEKRIKKIEDIIGEIKDKPLEYNINVEKLNVEKMGPDDLVFNLDNIDVKKLEGVLNIGINGEGMLKGKKKSRDKNLKKNTRNKSRKHKEKVKRDTDSSVQRKSKKHKHTNNIQLLG